MQLTSLERIVYASLLAYSMAVHYHMQLDTVVESWGDERSDGSLVAYVQHNSSRRSKHM
jgi:hypothetical protein